VGISAACDGHAHPHRAQTTDFRAQRTHPDGRPETPPRCRCWTLQVPGVVRAPAAPRRLSRPATGRTCPARSSRLPPSPSRTCPAPGHRASSRHQTSSPVDDQNPAQWSAHAKSAGVARNPMYDDETTRAAAQERLCTVASSTTPPDVVASDSRVPLPTTYQPASRDSSHKQMALPPSPGRDDSPSTLCTRYCWQNQHVPERIPTNMARQTVSCIASFWRLESLLSEVLLCTLRGTQLTAAPPPWLFSGKDHAEYTACMSQVHGRA
jgi:hypothetical protein